MNINEISKEHQNQLMDVSGRVEQVNQTSGPTMFVISDGSGTISAKAYQGAGKRAYPEIHEGDIVDINMQITVYNNILQGDVKSMEKSKEIEQIKKKIQSKQMERVSLRETSFLATTSEYNELKERMQDAARHIKHAIITNRPIVVRYHNDADGIISAYALEQAIVPLIEHQQGNDKYTWQYYRRAACPAPFYDIEDALKDSVKALNDQYRNASKMPLIVIVDNGSSEQDLLGIKEGKILGIDFIVVDHHFFAEDVISEQTLSHVNPFLAKEQNGTFAAGMLCTELARMIYDKVEINHLPAIAGFADRVENPLVMEQYVKYATDKGYTEEYMRKLVSVLDFFSAKVKFIEAREYVDILLGKKTEKQEQLVTLLFNHIKELDEKAKAIGSSTIVKEQINNVLLQLLDIEKTFGRNVYPKPGKTTGLLHDIGQEDVERVITVGVFSDFFTIRATKESRFSVHTFIDYAKERIEGAFIEGGGHECAGSIRFVPMKKEQMVDALKEFCRQL